MARWIDADVIRAKLMEYIGLTNGFERAFDEAPSIDIVRCSECKHWNGDGVFTINALGEEEQLCKWWSKFGTIRTASTDYCSYGERRE